MLFGAVGDLHGDFDALDRVMARHPDVTCWLCPGDLADEQGRYPTPRAPLYWIKGNNENFDFVDRQPPGHGTIPNLHYVPNGAAIRADGLTIAGLGGTFAPKWYDTPAAALGAASTARDDKRRHFVREDVERCEMLEGVDVFMSHEAARPFPIEVRRAKVYRVDAGKTPVNDVLIAMKPRVHLFGHHHLYSVADRQGVPSIGLEMVGQSYLIVDSATLSHRRYETNAGG